MQNFSHLAKNNVFSNNVFFGGQLHQNYVFMFSHNFDGIVSCNVMYAYTRIHCARKRGLKGHLPRVNLIELCKWPVGP